MADNMTKEERGKQMALVKNKNTKPEVELKHLFWNLGYHYRYAMLTRVSCQHSLKKRLHSVLNQKIRSASMKKFCIKSLMVMLKVIFMI